MRLFIDFPMLGRTLRQCCGSPNFWPKLVVMSRHRKFCRDRVFGLCRKLLSQLAVFFRDLFSQLFLGFCRNRFDNIVTEFLSRRLILVTTGFVVSRHKIVAPGSSYTFAFRKCSDIIFFVATCLFLFSLSTLLQ